MGAQACDTNGHRVFCSGNRRVVGIRDLSLGRFSQPLCVSGSPARLEAGAATGTDLLKTLTLMPFRHLQDVWAFGPDPNTLSVWFFLGSLFVIAWFRKRFSRPLFLFALGALLLPYITFNGSVGFISFT